MAGLRGRFGAGLTTRASCLLAAGLTALLCGLLLGVTDLVRAGVLTAALPPVAAIVVNRSRVRIANRRSAEPGRVAAGEAVTVHLTISNRSVLPTGVLMLEDQLPDQLHGRARFVIDSLSGRESRTVSYRMPDLPRGRYRAGPLRIRLTDPFKLIDITRSFTATTGFVVTPVVEHLGGGEPPRSYDIGDNAGSHSIGTHGADDASTREYRTGDDLRKIHWRSSARTGALMVRQEERPWQGQSTLLVDLRGPAHRGSATRVAADGTRLDRRLTSSLEWTVSAAASIGTHLLSAGRDVALLCDLADPQRLYPGHASRLAEYLGTVEAAPRADLVPLGGLVRTAARDSALVAVLGAVDAATLRLLADVRPRGASVPAFAMLLDVESWADPDADATGDAAEVDAATRPEAAAAVLRAAGWRVVIVRRDDSVAGAWRTLLRSSGGPDTRRSPERAPAANR